MNDEDFRCFWPNFAFSGWVVSWCHQYPILRVLESKEDVVHTIEPISQLCHNRATSTKKKHHFLPQNGKKNLFFAQMGVSFGLGGQFQAPSPILQVSDSKRHVLQGMGARKRVFQGRLPKKKVFFAHNGPKMRILDQTQCFFGLGWSLQRHPPFLQVLDFKIHVLQGMGAEKWVIQGRRTHKMPICLPNNGLKMPIWAEKSVLCARPVSSSPPHRILQVLHPSKHVYRVWIPRQGWFKAPSGRRSPSFAEKWPKNTNLG